jgi:hypothetical protein
MLIEHRQIGLIYLHDDVLRPRFDTPSLSILVKGMAPPLKTYIDEAAAPGIGDALHHACGRGGRLCIGAVAERPLQDAGLVEWVRENPRRFAG